MNKYTIKTGCHSLLPRIAIAFLPTSPIAKVSPIGALASINLRHYLWTAPTKLYEIMGSTGIDDRYRSSVSMRGVVSSTSTNKLTLCVNGNEQVALAA